MSRPSVPQQSSLRCPRCGANAIESESGSCSCCGSSLASARAPMRMAPGLGQEALRGAQRSATPAQGVFHASPTGQGFAAVRQQHEFGSWMQDEPSGLSHVLGLAGMMAVGLAFVVLALGGSLKLKHGGESGFVVALFVAAGLGLDAWAAWMLTSFYRAPFVRRIACVIEEHERTYRTKHGWRTRHYATFEFEDGSRSEHSVSASQAALITRGDCGVLITRHSVLLAFHRSGRL
jgi:hypothetical protein